MSKVIEKFQEVNTYLNECVFERSEEILLMLAAIISGQHVFLLGPPGTGKTMMIEKTMNCFTDDVELFKRLLMKTTPKEELFGPPDIKALKDGKYEYCFDKFLPTADFAILDEIWKCGSGSLNGLLTALNERKFDNGTKRIDIPLNTLFTASNELPQDESLGALYDRMAFRMEIPPLLKESSKLKIIDRMDGVDSEPDVPKVLSLDVVAQVREEASKVVFDKHARSAWIDVQAKLKQELANTCYVSDRRWSMAYRALKAIVYLNGGTEITRDDFYFLSNLLWEEPKQRQQISSMLNKYMGAVSNRSKELYNRIAAAYEDIVSGVVPKGELPNLYAEAKGAKDSLDAESGDSAVFQMYQRKFDTLFQEIRDRYFEFSGLA